MRKSILALSAALAFNAVPAFAADRPVTDIERQKLQAVLTELNCNGGKFEFDDGKQFEIDNASCSDGLIYDFKFDTSYKLISREREN